MVPLIIREETQLHPRDKEPRSSSNVYMLLVERYYNVFQALYRVLKGYFSGHGFPLPRFSASPNVCVCVCVQIKSAFRNKNYERRFMELQVGFTDSEISALPHRHELFSKRRNCRWCKNEVYEMNFSEREQSRHFIDN